MLWNHCEAAWLNKHQKNFPTSCQSPSAGENSGSPLWLHCGPSSVLQRGSDLFGDNHTRVWPSSIIQDVWGKKAFSLQYLKVFSQGRCSSSLATTKWSRQKSTAPLPFLPPMQGHLAEKTYEAPARACLRN